MATLCQPARLLFETAGFLGAEFLAIDADDHGHRGWAAALRSISDGLREDAQRLAAACDPTMAPARYTAYIATAPVARVHPVFPLRD